MVELCTKEQLADIFAEFDTNEEFAKKDVRRLMEWLEKQPHLPNVKGKFTAYFESLQPFHKHDLYLYKLYKFIKIC